MGLLDYAGGPRPLGMLTPDLAQTEQPVPMLGMLGSSVAPPNMGGMPQSVAELPDTRPWYTKLMDHMMPQPAGTQGLLSPEQQKHARTQGLLALGAQMLANSRVNTIGAAPSLMQSLASGIQAGQQGARQSALQDVEGNVQGMQLQHQMQVLQARAAIGQHFAPQPGETPSQQIQRLQQMYSAFAQIGDTEMMSKLGDVLKGVFENQVKPINLEHIDSGDKTDLIDPRSGNVVRSIPKQVIRPYQDIDTGDRKVLLDPITHQVVASIQKGPAPRDPNITYEMEEQRRFQRESKISDEFRQDTKPQQDAAIAYNTIQSMKQAALAGDPNAQNDLLMASIKLQHPNATVRRGEMLSQEDTRSLPDNIVQMWKKAQTGSRLSQTQVQNILRNVEGVMDQHRARYRSVRGTYLERAKRFGVDPNALPTIPGLDDATGNRIDQFLK